MEALLKKHQVPANLVQLEVTETAMVTLEESLERLTELSELGVSIALDDFGTGYTGFTQLINYPAACLKIDRSFISGTSPAKNGRGKLPADMLETLISMGKLYDLKLVGEGVETPEQLERLRSLGCDYAQGYFLSRPVTLDAIKTLVENQSWATHARKVV